MDQAAGKPIRRDSSRKTRGLATAHSRTPYGGASRRRKQLKKEAAPEEQEYPVREIRDEENRNGKLWYLIDWEDNKITGEKYDQTWEPAEFVNEEAIRDWEEQRSGGRREGGTQGTNEASSLFVGRNISQPIRTAKRKRTSKTGTEYSPTPEPEAKKVRPAGSTEVAPFQYVLQETLNPQARPLKIQDSYESPQTILGNGFGLRDKFARVEIPPVPEGFNRDDYPAVQLSQLSQSTQDITSSPIADHSSLLEVQFRKPARRIRLIFEEDDIEGIIPDSQEPGSSPFIPPTTQASRTDNFETTAPETEANQNSSLQNDSSLDSRIAEAFEVPESLSYQPSNRNQGDSEQSWGSEAVNSSSSEARVEPTQESTSNSQPNFTNKDLSTSESLSAANQEDTLRSSQQPATSLEFPSTPPRVVSTPIGFPAAATSLSQNGGGQPPESNGGPVSPSVQSHTIIDLGSSAPFQTQLPFLPSEASARSSRAKTTQSQSGEAQLSPVKSLPRTSTPAPYTSPPPTSAVSRPINDSSLAHTPKSSHQSSPFRTPEALSRPSTSQNSRSVLQSIESGALNISNPGHRTYSNSAMDAAFATPTGTVKEKIRLARDQALAKRRAEREAERSASTLPASPAPPSGPMLPLRETVVDVPLHVIEPVSVPSPKPSPNRSVLSRSPKVSPDPEISSDSSPKVLRIHAQPPNDYIVPLPMVSHTRDIYVQILINHQPQRIAIIQDDVEPSILFEIDSMIEELGMICSHPDLAAIDFSTQRVDPAEMQARYAETVSTKCIFFAELFGPLRPFDKHIVIVCQGGRMREILEAMLLHYGFEEYPDRPSTYRDASGGPLKFSLLSPHGMVGDGVVDAASVVIAFDSSPSESYLKSLRSDSSSPNYEAPLISLVVTHSVEHLNLCLEKDITTSEKRLRLVDWASQIMDEVGKLGHDHPEPPEAAAIVASWINDTKSTWPVPPLDDIHGIEFDSPSQPQLTMDSLNATTQSYDMSQHAQMLSMSAKRHLDADDTPGSDSSKRQRLSPRPSEQTGMPTSTANSTVQTQDLTDSALLKKISDLEQQLRSRDANEVELREQNANLEARVRDLESGVEDIQPKYQEALNEQGYYESEITRSLAREQMLRKKLEDRIAEVTKFKESNQSLEAELATVRIELSSSTIPGVAQLNDLREDIRKAQEEKERQEKRYLIKANEFDYLQNLYQTTSNQGMETIRELGEVQKELEKYKEMADVTKIRIHEIYDKSENEQLIARIKELQAENEELDKELEKKTEELRVVTTGRRATRGTSVPRSPRMGQGTMSPTPRPIGRVIGNIGGSRGNSPAPGEMPLRSQFGEALFQGSRFQNHLRDS
ncbi:hypothetical protein B0J14DRAFT_245299 [Halenospora varia]|nr:hypothetical protein B0J14DRAFT_245299 [Halenospora varia]